VSELPWFRMYSDVINDPKVMRLAEATRWHWVAVLCVACKSGGRVPPTRDVAFLLRMTEKAAALILTELHSAGLLDRDGDGFVPHNWDGRQFKSDRSNERVQRHREKKRNATGNVTGGVTGTPPEQSRAETEQSRADARAVDDLGKGALRAGLRAVLGSEIDLSRADGWLSKGYDVAMVLEVVRELHARKPDIASLAYFELALAERHENRAMTPSERAAYGAKTNFDSVIDVFARTGVWSRYAGPEPGMLGCRAPPELLAKHGIGPDGRKLPKQAA
jgi:hypothetical protein